MLNKLINAFIDAIFPRRCMLCDEIIFPQDFLCKDCEQQLKINKSKRCISCGAKYKECLCDKYIYLFDGMISPYFNYGIPKKTYYNYKFKKIRRNAKFFAEKMAEAVNEWYDGIEFDFITRVPSSKSKGFDHTKYLSEELAECLKLKLVDSLESTEKERKLQRTLHREERFRNVDSAYRLKLPCKGKTILLLDDIRTTGATLNECTRVLKYAGAKKVYCVSVLAAGNENSR